MAGTHALSDAWARDLAVFYGLRPGDRLTVVIERRREVRVPSDPKPDLLDVRCQVKRREPRLGS